MEAAFAQLLVEYCLEAQEGETILVEAEVPALRLLPHLKRAFLKRGAYPVFRIGYPGEGRDFLLYGGAWLERIPEVERALYEKADKFLRILSAENPLEGASLDPGLFQNCRRGYRGYGIGYPGEGRDFLLYGGAWLERIPEVAPTAYKKPDKLKRTLSTTA
ncbi:aminopeptidase, partial [Thermus scotoductus]|uniref:aminopeptidase n=1 Tax=Thermus scotoductus TaxID=37636 RepID=UPI0020A353A9